MEEMWKPVPGFPGYEVSNCGRVRSYRKRGTPPGSRYSHPHLLSASFSGEYRRVALRRNGHTYVRKVGNLVLSAFVGPRPDGMEVCHNDLDPANDHLSNLRYDTHASNLRDGFSSDVEGRLTNEEALQVRLLAKQGVSDRELADRFGVSTCTIKDCRLGKYYQSAGGPITNRLADLVKLTDAEVRRLRREARQRDVTQRQLAREYGVSESFVSKVVHCKRRWPLPDPGGEKDD